MDWDNLRFFLAVAESGSIRAAAKSLELNHSTVSRRITQFEKTLGVRLFDRSVKGYALTSAGEDMLQSARRIGDEVSGIDRRIAGRDTQLKGTLRVTVPGSLISNWLMPVFGGFAAHYPGIELEIVTSYVSFDLAKLEADVAIRITNTPPEYLVGRKIARYATAVYASLDYLASHDLSDPASLSWIGWDEETVKPKWVLESDYSAARVWHQINDPVVQTEAAKAGLGLAMIPCFLGDQEPSLRRVPPGTADPKYDIWILSHRDLRNTTRVRTFTRFVVDSVADFLPLIEGGLSRT